MQDMGLPVSDDVPLLEQVNASMSYLIPRMRVPGSGATSDGEIRLFAAAVPSMGKDEMSNLRIARGLMQIADRNNKVYDLAQTYFRDNNGMVGFSDYVDQTLGPIFPRPSAIKLPDGTISPEYSKLKPGTLYWHPEYNGFAMKSMRR